MNEIELPHVRQVDGEAIEIAGFVSISQGKDIICENKRNHFVDQGMRSIVSAIIAARTIFGSSWRLPSETWSIYIGEDTVTGTAYDTTALTNPIGVAPGTAPSNQQITGIHSGVGDGDWYATWQATWNAGTVAGTLGEAALYTRCADKATFGWEIPVGSYIPGVELTSRLSSADGDFGSFVIDGGVALTIDWKLQLLFA